MKPEEQRRVIALACGWKRIGSCWVCPVTKRGWVSVEPPPNYPACLNAMREAEEALSDGQWNAYLFLLNRNKVYTPDMRGKHICHATASEKSDAFIKALGTKADSYRVIAQNLNLG